MLPKGPGAGAPGSMKHAEISAWDVKGSERSIPPPHPLGRGNHPTGYHPTPTSPRKGSVLGAQREPR